MEDILILFWRMTAGQGRGLMRYSSTAVEFPIRSIAISFVSDN